MEEERARSRSAHAARVRVLDAAERHVAYRASRLAIACCGTVSVELALARIRQLAAHEVGHTLGLVHNFAASTYGGRATIQ